MGIRNALRLQQSTLNDSVPLPQIASPWAASPSHLEALPWYDILGEEFRPITRGVAMAVPAVARSRQLLATTIARCPLEAWRGDERLADQPTWTYRSDLGVSPYHRMLWTVDDLIFFGWSLWTVYRGADGEVLDAARIPYEWWNADTDGTINVTTPDGETETPSAAEVVLIPGPHEGVLAFGSTALRQAAGLAAAALKVAETPVPNIDLHYTGDRQLSETEIEALLAWWVKARKGDNGGVAYTNKYTEVREVGSPAEHLLIEGRNASAVDIARMFGLPASMIDATNAQASLTYETSQGRNAEFIDYGVSQYMDAIAARLSLDDVVPRGQSTRFDTEQLRALTPSPTGPITED